MADETTTDTTHSSEVMEYPVATMIKAVEGIVIQYYADRGIIKYYLDQKRGLN